MEKEIIKFYDKQPADYSETFTAVMPPGIKSKEELLLILEKELRFPYFGHNWDSLEELLHDLTWIKESKLSLYHQDIPKINYSDIKIYLKILSRAVHIHSQGKREGFELPTGKYSLEVYFPSSLKSEIQEIISS
jgi:hypothetical protein